MKNTSVILVGLVTAYLLTGCANITVLEPNGGMDERVGRVPEIGVVGEAPVGSTMFSQFKYWSRTGYRVKSEVRVGLGLGRVSVADGDFLLRSNVDGQEAYCTEKSAYIDPLTGPFKTACFIDVGKQGRFEKVKAQPGMIWFEKALDPSVPYERSEMIAPRADSFKYEIIYQGYSKGTVRVAYREFLNDFARPSFYQDVSYDITAFPADVTFKSVKLQILGADNNGVRYKVLSGF
jgi:hypothetical protein